ncbi:MAG: DMT family transporter [Alphaproteobacteria bacterium]|nr:DMT family transporter [Alphaproteobacteria bacterium]
MSDVPTAAVRPSKLPMNGFLLLAAVTLFWGVNWPAMKTAVAEVPVWWFRGMCVWAGAIGLLTIAKLSGASLRMPRNEIPRLLLVSSFAMLGWQICSGYGVLLMPAGRAAIIAFTMPVWASLLSARLIDEPVTRPKIIGLSLGMAGLAVLMGEDLLVFGTAPLGAFFMLAAALCWAVGTVLFKKYTWTPPIAVLVGWQLAATAVPISIIAVLFEPAPDFSNLSSQAIFSLAYIFALPMVFCQWAYFKVVSIFPALVAAMGTLAVPIVGVYSSALILGEPAGWLELVALALICMALASVLILPELRR